MKNIGLVILIGLILAVAVPKEGFCANEELDSTLRECRIVFEEITQVPEGIPERLLKKATGIVIFPSTIKGAFFLGARYGKGVALYRDPDTKVWSTPAFFEISGISFGWQVGGQAIDLIFVIPTQRGFEGMLKNKFNVGTNSALVIGPIGRNAELGTDITLKGGIFTYSRAKGLFAGIGLKGLAITPNESANSQYYGPELSVRDILMKGRVEATPEAQRLIKTVSKHTK